jgi:threonylcarbamoyladenosine tRNA methylthiotransferase MtaB
MTVVTSDPVVITLGCRLNGFESEVMRRHATNAGLDNAIIINTCAVTGEAVRQAAQTIRRVRREQPSARIIVTGCAAQVEPERFAAMPDVDHVIGNSEKLKAETFAGLATSDFERVRVNDIMSVREHAPHMIDGLASHTRAWVQVQNGCDHRCTFCIIPYGRGPSRSVPAGEVVAQIDRLVESGVAEIVLTGVDITSYGPDLPGSMTLGKLVQQILRHVPDLKRLRMSSIDQVEVDRDLIAAIADDARVMPHLHLSMQSGDDMILKRMKRRHSSTDAIQFCETVRRLRPDVVFGADLIAGFPTESDEMFENSMRIVDACGLTYLHVFPFSPREGTPAARMPQLDRGLIKARAAQLRAKGAEQLNQYLANQIGQTVEVLTENGGTGRTPQFAEMKFSGPDVPAAGHIVSARIVDCTETRLIGELAA